ncbi:MAG: NAD(P)H-dependent oxidoreductase [Desulfovibrio sp.]|nr:NAD(P)H-dependent oxidoreductase [Desulfovibrio sp.]
MSTLLYLQASPRKERSYSTQVADIFVQRWREANPGSAVTVKNLFEESLMPFDGHALQARYHARQHELLTPEEREAWAQVTLVAEEFKAADRLVIASPMWNFMIPYRLKHYLDILIQPGLTFTVTPEGQYQGLATRTKALCVLARGSAYPAGTPAEAYDFQSKYLQFALGFIGVTDVTTLCVEPTLAGKEQAEQARDAMAAKARELAATF